MKRSHRSLALAVRCAVAIMLASSCAKREPTLIPTQILFGNPTNSAPVISPDAKRLAYLAPYNGALNIWIKSMGRSDDRPLTREQDLGVKKFLWAYDNRHILYSRDAAGNGNWRLYGLDADTGEVRDYTPFDSVTVEIVDYSKRFPHDLVISMRPARATGGDAYRLDLETGTLTLLAKNPGNVARWYPDADFLIRGAMTYRVDGGYNLVVRSRVGAPWVRIASWDYEEIGSSGALRFTRDGSGLYCLDSRGSNAGQLVRISTADSSVQVIAGDPRYDIVQAFLQIDTYEIQAVAFAREHIEWTVLDSTLAKDFAVLARLDRGDFEFESGDASDSTWVVGYNHDDGAMTYYTYSRKTGQGSYLFDEIPALKPYTLARMEPISFRARDGLEIHGYLTCPPGAKPRNLPLVVRVHGGPWSRDYWGYNPEVQWLANRGYACLQVNFRGSRGYGKEFLHAGNRELGGKMEDDLVDGARWAVERGTASPKRLAVFGTGYGGYAVLSAATEHPGLFACGVDVSGPPDLIGWVGALSASWGGASPVLFKRVGDPRADADFLRSRSPLFMAERITTPLMISQGGKDPYVPAADVERIVAALKANGTPNVYLYFADEGPGIYRPPNRLKFWEAAEKFLAEYLGGRSAQSARH